MDNIETLQEGFEDSKIQCPHCESINCFQSTEIETKTVSYLCLRCGYTTNTFFTNESVQLQNSFNTSPTLIKELSFHDEERGLIWIPSVLNMGKLGIIYPKGSRNNWNWEYAKIIDIPRNKQKDYPVLGKENVFYKSRLDVENAQKFEWDDFIGACEEMGITDQLAE